MLSSTGPFTAMVVRSPSMVKSMIVFLAFFEMGDPLLGVQFLSFRNRAGIVDCFSEFGGWGFWDDWRGS